MPDAGCMPPRENIVIINLSIGTEFTYKRQPQHTMIKKKQKRLITEDMPAPYAVALLLWQELEVLTQSEAILKQQKDDEVLHSFRISIRRTRALISQTKSILREDEIRGFMEGFKWIGSFTTPVRDLDVLSLKLDDYGQSIPEEYRKNLVIISDFLHQQREVAYATLMKDIGSHRYQQLIRDWRRYLQEHLTDKQAHLPGETILAVANNKTWAVYNRVLHEGQGISDQSPAEALHELRKTCKKLRYLIDFFSDLHPRKQVRKLIKILKKLQDYLGDFQDAEAHLHLLSEYRHHRSLGPAERISFLLIVELLIGELHHREAQLRDAFPEYFSMFDREETHELFSALYNP
jgi:CHAD domain-containing protein